MDKVSVIIPTYNRAGYIGNAINSVLEQSYPNIEIIVVDDGSEDNTQEILNKYKNQISVIKQCNKGCSSARNEGLKICTGKFVAFLDSDDVWFRDKISIQVKLLERYSGEVCCCWCNMLIEQHGKQKDRLSLDHLHPTYSEGIWTNPTEILATRFVLFNQAALVRKDALDCIGFFDESLWVMEDFDLALRLSQLGPWAFTARPLVLCREGAENRISEEAYLNRSILAEICIRIYSKFLNSPRKLSAKVVTHLKINRHFWWLEKKFYQAGENSLGSAVLHHSISFYLKTIRVISRRYFRKIDIDIKLKPH